MSPKPIGIIGGAGPLAGAWLLKRVFTLCGTLFGCIRDADFPKVIFVSFPFSEMLAPRIDASKVRSELRECLALLRKEGAVLLAIACNTLHAFLDEDVTNLISLPETLAESIQPGERPLVFCTSTSMKCALHRQSFPCLYPDPKTQARIDWIIDQILRGKEPIEELAQLIDEQDVEKIVLGCTELSLLRDALPGLSKTIIDPLELVALKLVERSFQT